MCNLSEAVFQKGVDHAVETKKQEWVNEGRSEGRNEGILEERLNTLIRYMNKTHYSLEEAMEFNDLPLSEYDYYAELLEKKMN